MKTPNHTPQKHPRATPLNDHNYPTSAQTLHARTSDTTLSRINHNALSHHHLSLIQNLPVHYHPHALCRHDASTSHASPSPPRFALARFEPLRERFDGTRVQNIFGLGPTAPGGEDAKEHFVHVFEGVGVGVDAEGDFGFHGELGVGVAEVEAVAVGVDFESDAGAGGGEDDAFHVGFEAAAGGDEAAGGMADDAHVRVGDGVHEAGGGGLGFLGEGGVGGGDDPIELGEKFVFVVEAAIGEDVDFAAGEDEDAFDLFGDGVDGFDVVEEAVGAEAVGLELRFGVVGDGAVLVAAAFAFGDHFFDGAGAVGGGGVHMEVATDVGEFEDFEVGLGGEFEGFEFAAVFAEFGGHPGEVEGLVDFFFGFSGDEFVAFKQAPFIEFEAFFDGAFAEFDVVGEAAGEVLEGGAERFRGDDADIDLHPPTAPPQIGAGAEAGFGVAGGEGFGHRRMGQNFLGNGGAEFGVGGEGDVDVADGFAATAEGAAVFGAGDAGDLAEVVEEVLGEGVGGAEADAAGGLGEVGDGLFDFFEFLFADAFDFGNGFFVDGFEELGDGGDVAFMPEEGGGFGADGGDFHHVHDAGGNFGPEFFELGDVAGFEVLADFGGGGFADAGGVVEVFGGGEGGDVVGEIFEGAGDFAVGEDAERVFALDGEDVGSAVEELGEGAFFMGGSRVWLHDNKQVVNESVVKPPRHQGTKTTLISHK